jgi:hypothetical protein
MAEFFPHTHAETNIIETTGLNVGRLTTFSRGLAKYLADYKKIYR